MRKVVYTCLFGEGDDLKEPLKYDPSWDYVVFTDNPNLTSEHWQVRYVPREIDSRKQSRYYKINYHLFFDHEIVVYIDATFQIKYKLDAFAVSKRSGIWLNKHPQRDSLYEEAQIVIEKGLDSPSTITAQLTKYESEAIPHKSGLWRCGIMVRSGRNEKVKELCDIWWKEVEEFSWRDQISFPYACIKAGIKPSSIMRGITNNFFQQHLHKPNFSHNTDIEIIEWGEEYNGTEINKKINEVPKNKWVLLSKKSSEAPQPITTEAHLIELSEHNLLFPRWLHNYIRFQQNYEQELRYDDQFKKLIKQLNGTIYE